MHATGIIEAYNLLSEFIRPTRHRYYIHWWRTGTPPVIFVGAWWLGMPPVFELLLVLDCHCIGKLYQWQYIKADFGRLPIVFYLLVT
jgi:hypothetical protein